MVQYILSVIVDQEKHFASRVVSGSGILILFGINSDNKKNLDVYAAETMPETNKRMFPVIKRRTF